MNPNSQAVYGCTTTLERVLSSAFLAFFVAFGLIMFMRQVGQDFVWPASVPTIAYPFAFVFSAQMLNFLTAKHDGSICLSDAALKLSDNKSRVYASVPLLLTALAGTIVSFLYGAYGNEQALFGMAAIICFLMLLGYEEYCRSRRFRRVLAIPDIDGAWIVHRRRRSYVFVSHKNDWIGLPRVRHPEQLLEAINALRKGGG